MSEAVDTKTKLGNYFQSAVDKTLEKFLSYISFTEFKTKFPEIYQENQAHLREIHQQLISQLRGTITKDINNLCTDTNLYPSLKLLDDITMKHCNKSGEDSWRPTGNPEDDTRDHIYQLKQRHKKCLEFALETIVAENELLEKAVRQNHADILELKKEVDTSYQEVSNELAVLNDGNIARLGKDIKAAFEKQ